jgi:tetratricopeptide (TPR) repeat protein
VRIFLLVAALLAAEEPASNPYLVQARVLYQGLYYEKALARLNRALKWKQTGDAERAEIHLLRGLCHAQLGAAVRARSDWEQALSIDPKLALPPMTSPKIRADFEKIRERLAPPVEPPPPLVEPPAPVMPVPAPRVTEPPIAEPLVPAPPPAAAPAVKGKNHVPWLIAGGAAAAVAGAGGFFAYRSSANAKAAYDSHWASDAAALGNQAHRDANTANVLYGIAGAAAAAGVALYFVF